MHYFLSQNKSVNILLLAEPVKNDLGLCPYQSIELFSPIVQNKLRDQPYNPGMQRNLEHKENKKPHVTANCNNEFSPCSLPRQQTRLRRLQTDLDSNVNRINEFKSCASGQIFVSMISPGAALGGLLKLS